MGSYLFSNRVLSEEGDLFIDLVSVDYEGFGFIVVRLPAEFGVNTGGCVLPAGFVCVVNRTGFDNSVVVEASVVGTPFVFPFQFTVKNITTPRFTPSSRIYL